VQDPQVPHHARLVDVDHLDDVAHRPLALTQRLDDGEARGVGQDLEGLYLHQSAYA
jgi:hypothetical protein